MKANTSRREPLILLVGIAIALAVSAYRPFDRVTWWLEVAPIFLVVPILAASYRSFPLTPLVYRLIALHALILMIGGHYTYARVPLGFWMQEWFDLSRNHYDRLGHFAQGFIPAMVAREILLRHSVVRRGPWLAFLICSICLSVSACYEFIEWWSAVLGGEAATDFLGTQGDVWDTQWDMLLALLGSIAAQVCLSRVHDKQLAVFEHTP